MRNYSFAFQVRQMSMACDKEREIRLKGRVSVKIGGDCYGLKISEYSMA